MQQQAAVALRLRRLGVARAILPCAFAFAFINIYLLWDFGAAIDDASTAANSKLVNFDRPRPKATPAREAAIANVSRAPPPFEAYRSGRRNATAGVPGEEVAGPILRPDERFDVIDVGSSKAGRYGSINFLRQALGDLDPDRRDALDPRTLGLDNDPVKVGQCNAEQLRKKSKNRCAVADILTLTPDDLGSNHTIRGNTFWHVLEHMPDCALAEEMWIKAAALSSSFSSFHGPAFDHELSREGEVPTGYHRFWENWHGHRCHFNSTMLERAMRGVAKTQAHVIVNYFRIASTDHPLVLPPGTPKDSIFYDPAVMPPKESLPLPDGLYEEMRGCAVYDKGAPHGWIGLFAALCLHDALHPGKGKGFAEGFDVVSCSVGDFEGEECVQALSFLATEAIVRYFNKDIERLRDII